MKIDKNRLKQIIKEEIRSLLYTDRDESLKTNIIHAFISAINSLDPNELLNNLQNIHIDPIEAINYLDREEVDSDFYVNACEIHNSLVRLLGRGEEMHIDAFAHFPEVNHNPNKDPDPNFMRVPKVDRAYDQEDTRKNRKNYIQ